MHVARNLYPAIKDDDPDAELLTHEGANRVFDFLLENEYYGNKSGQGFYKKVINDEGEKEFHALNLQTLEYEPPQKVRFESVGKHRKADGVGNRIKLMLGEDDRAAEFLRDHFAFYLSYASKRVPEITESIVNVDNAQRWGFAHKLGPFEIWDAIGVEETVEQFEEMGYDVADWVTEMLDSGKDTFYQRDENGKIVGYYSPQDSDYLPLEQDERVIKIADLKADGHIVESNDGANIIDMGDGIALLEMTTQQSTIDSDFVEMGLLRRGDAE